MQCVDCTASPVSQYGHVLTVFVQIVYVAVPQDHERAGVATSTRGQATRVLADQKRAAVSV